MQELLLPAAALGMAGGESPLQHTVEPHGHLWSLQLLLPVLWLLSDSPAYAV